MLIGSYHKITLNNNSMKLKNIFLFTFLSLSFLTLTSYFNVNSNTQTNKYILDKVGGDTSSPVSLKMYNIIEELCNEYEIPRHIVYNITYMETKYKGPFHWNYNPYLTSSGGAEGPMQIMPSTANGIHKEVIDRKRLRTDLRLNIETGLKLLKKLHNKYGEWSQVCGCYNTGQPIINKYAIYCSSNIDYKNKWVEPQ
jgi:soluble lytic murein transglycosylase-like protein